jgi:hypothetical protein
MSGLHRGYAYSYLTAWYAALEKSERESASIADGFMLDIMVGG